MARKKRKKKRKLKIKNILIFLLSIVLFCGLICLIVFMPVKNIYIIGNNIISDEIIIDEAHLDSYPSFFLTSSSTISRDLKKNEYIDNIIVKKKIGNIIEIKVKEYEVIAIDNNDKILLSNGNLVDNKYNITDIARISNDIPDNVRKKISERFIKINKNILRQISQIEYSPVKVDDERFLLYMDDGNIVYITLTKIKKMNKYNEIRNKLGGRMGVIYLDSGDYVEFKDNKAVINNNEDKKE